jgi:predicted transposase YdaD
VWAAAFVLLGVRYSDDFAAALFEEVLGMEESTTYQAIIRRGEAIGEARGQAAGRAEGRAEEARRMLLLLGQDKFGPPDAATLVAVQAITDIERLEALGRQVRQAETWQQLLPPPAPRRRARRKRAP